MFRFRVPRGDNLILARRRNMRPPAAGRCGELRPKGLSSRPAKGTMGFPVESGMTSVAKGAADWPVKELQDWSVKGLQERLRKG